MQYLEFEKSIQELDERLSEALSEGNEEEVKRLEARIQKTIEDIFSRLTPWQRVLLARHPDRPHALYYVYSIFSDVYELHGDRCGGDDPALITGVARFENETVFFAAQEKGGNARERQKRNFGMAHPEGYRKAMRIMELARRFNKPFITLVDTPGAYPGVEAEERGQATAIAECIERMLSLPVPTLSVIIGEGGSGGALALASADRILMMEHSIFSVISPEGCASILFRNSSRAPQAAEMLKLTAPELLQLGIVDDMVKEPLGGAHRDPPGAVRMLKDAIARHLSQIQSVPLEERVNKRFEKYKKMGVFRVEV